MSRAHSPPGRLAQPGETQSMTGFAAAEGEAGGLRWRWELRSVNGRGLELRLRLPHGWDSLEPDVRAAAQARFERGSLMATLSLGPLAGGSGEGEEFARAARRLLAARRTLEALGLPLAPVAAEALLALETQRPVEAAPGPALAQALRIGFDDALLALAASRRGEGARLRTTLAGHLATVARLAARAEAEAAAANLAAAGTLKARVEALMEGRGELDPARLAQELALLAVKSDVREEIDRLRAHAAAAEALLEQGGAVGRKLDFLAQEFNREANTLCAKSPSLGLTRVGLDLKLAIDQLREQAQNLE
ncbi:YicC/YloC family endoribonuclease [Neomegalonema sp.]|uniref:YicC/YloC family endoribonuclease n=1 Tax=Neomegalonema sp. TaxID=2039713 RepID=UPI0026205105|nr:YicC/YloC family endoribonuclease [Neomegalonema sp.]MDD2870054.1 YicC family protein [Neomegalonema sp.]